MVVGRKGYSPSRYSLFKKRHLGVVVQDFELVGVGVNVVGIGIFVIE